MFLRCLVLGVLLVTAVTAAEAASNTTAGAQPICAVGEMPCGSGCYKPGAQNCSNGTCSLALPASASQSLGVSTTNASTCLPYINACGGKYCTAGERCVQSNCTTWTIYAASARTTRSAAAQTFAQDSCQSVLAASVCGLSSATLQAVNCTTLTTFALASGSPKCYATASFKCAEGGGFAFTCSVEGHLSSAAATGGHKLRVALLNATIAGAGSNATIGNVAVVGNITNTTGPSNATIYSITNNLAAAATAGSSVSAAVAATGATGPAGAAGSAGAGTNGTGSSGTGAGTTGSSSGGAPSGAETAMLSAVMGCTTLLAAVALLAA